MQLANILNAVKEYSFNLSEDLQDYIEVQSGKATCQEAQLEQVEIDDQGEDYQQSSRMETEQLDDFHMEIDQQNVDSGSSIKTYQFNSGMFAPSKAQGKAINSKPNLKLELQECFGFNSKEKSTCAMLSPTCFCFALGCSLVLCSLTKETQIKSYRMFQQHVYQICTLCYSPKTNTLISGSKGLKPELLVWNFNENQNDGLSLKLVHRFRLCRNFQGVGEIAFLNDSNIFCTNSVSIHRGNQIKFFDISEGTQLQICRKTKQKILDYFFDEAEQKMYLATNRGVMLLNNCLSNLEIADVGDKKQDLITICYYKQFILTGDQSGNIQVLTAKGKRISRTEAHKGLVFNMYIIQENSLLLTSGTEDNQVKIYQLQLKQPSLTLSLIDSIEMNSYCTSISHINEENILLGFRDGSIIVYDSKKKKKKLEKNCQISCVERVSSSLMDYNRAKGALMFIYNKSTLCELTLNKKSKNETKFLKLKKSVRCIGVYQDKILQVCASKDKQFCLSLSKSKCGQFTDLQNFELDKEGKPKKCAFNSDLAVVGTKYGYVVVLLLSKPVKVISDQHHCTEVEDIILQEGKFKQNQPFYIKTVSGSELFYWQIQAVDSQLKLKRISKAGPLKNLSWCNVCKYSWDSRNIWEEMTHFQDIESIAKISDKYMCASMSDGKLRIYRYPATKGNFVQYKLFPGKFNLLSTNQNYLICERNYEMIVLNLAQSSI